MILNIGSLIRSCVRPAIIIKKYTLWTVCVWSHVNSMMTAIKILIQNMKKIVKQAPSNQMFLASISTTFAEYLVRLLFLHYFAWHRLHSFSQTTGLYIGTVFCIFSLFFPKNWSNIFLKGENWRANDFQQFRKY